MKKKLKVIISLICAFIIFFSSTIFVVINALNKRVKDYHQNLNYEEVTTAVLNPNQGFYRTACISVTPDGIKEIPNIISKNFQMYHLRMDISAFSNVQNGESDLELTLEALKSIEDLIETFFEAGKNIIIRFAYDKDFSGLKDQEPSEEMILTHIVQLSSVLNKYPLTISAIETGMIGPWGEMHSSQIAVSETISKIIDTFLTSTSKIPILVRTPQMNYDYLKISIEDIETYTINKNSKAYRLGVFNDGYLGSETDLGTYDNRELEVQWLSKQTSHLPYGGEVTRPESTLHDIDKCLPEMFKLNLSYLNYEWNDDIVQKKWQEQIYDNTCGTDSKYYGQTAYNYIKEHLGYRLVLKESIFSYSGLFDKLNVKLTIDNVGFGEFYNSKTIVVYLVGKNKLESPLVIGTYKGENIIEFSIDITKYTGTYSIYLGLVSAQNGKICYPIRFANDLWNDTLQANHIGNIIIR